jgi:CubicO group peptidase (beta-lactamase class C family)
MRDASKFHRPAVWLAIFGLLLAVLAGCPNEKPKESAQSEVKQAPAAAAASNRTSDLERAIAALDAAIPGIMKDWSVPGMAVAVVSGNATVYAKGFGVRKAGGQAPVDPSTMFQIGSCSKAFTATLAASFADQGAFAFDDPVADHLAFFQLQDSWVTANCQVCDLMAQHLGLPPYSLDSLAALGYSADDILGSLYYVDPVSSFRTQFAYLNTPFLAVAALLENYGGKSYETLLQERILGPLGMDATNTRVRAMAQNDNAATGHILAEGEAKPLPWNAPYQQTMNTLAPAGGVNSNVQDMAKWLIFNLNNGVGPHGRLVKQESMEFLRTPQTRIGRLPDGRLLYYCQGWVYLEDAPGPIIWHNGQTFGMSSLAAFSPADGVGLVMLSNMVGDQAMLTLRTFFGALHGRDVAGLRAKALQAHQKELEENQPVPAPEHPSPALPASAYTGSYASDIYGECKITNRDGQLALVLGPREDALALRHFDRDVFQSRTPWPGNEPCSVRFGVGADGKADLFTTDCLEDSMESFFSRIDDEALQTSHGQRSEK